MKNRFALTSTTFAALTASLLALTNAQAADLNIEVAGVAEAKGEVMVALFNKSEGWLHKGVIASTATAAQVGMVKLSFPNLAEGEYAVSVIHDLNSNKKLDANAVGMPIEPYGFSNDAAGNFGPPTFDQAKFKFGPESKSITIKLG
jgi:uncharacterized protein (DUF2141 family)